MDLSGDFPIETHPTWDIHDATKIGEYLICPRKYFYKYVLGWRREGANHHIEFGTAWHLAMAHLLRNDYSVDSIDGAHKLFTDHFRKFFPPEFDEDIAPKTPSFALTGLVEYVSRYAAEDRKYKVMETDGSKELIEIAGSVLISEKHKLQFRMDSVLSRPDGKIMSREHKTGSRVTRAWMECWSTDFQVSTYNHVLRCKYDPKQVWGVEINGFFPQKGENKFERPPAGRSLKAMREWLWEANYYMDEIEWQFHQLREAKKEDSVMRAFPRNCRGCSMFNRPCSMLPFCATSMNPLEIAHVAQPGMEIYRWNPADYTERVPGAVLELTKLEV